MSDDDINKEEINFEDKEAAEAPKKELRIPKLEDISAEPAEDGAGHNNQPEQKLRIPQFEEEDLPKAPEPQEHVPEEPSHFVESEGLNEIQKYMPQNAAAKEEEEKPFQNFGQDETEDDSSDAGSTDEGLRIPSLDDLPSDTGTEKTDDMPSVEADQSQVESGSEAGENDKENLRVADKPREQEVNYVTSDVINIKIGDDVGLTNKDPTLIKIRVGAGWEVRSFEGDPPDLDLCCFILNKNNQTRKDPDFVFYNNTKSEEEEVVHKGDSRTGAGEGDDETIEIDLQAFPFEVAALMFTITIHEGELHEQDFSMTKDVFLRISNAETDYELCKLSIPDQYLEEHKGAAMKVGQVFRDGPKWRFHACTEIYPKGGLRRLATEYGILVM